MTGRRLLLLVVAALLCAAAALAIGILLFGDFGTTEGRILATTALLAAYGMLTLPAAILQDQRRLRALAAIVVVLAVAGASLSITAVWAGDSPEALGKAVGTVTGWLIVAAQIAGLAARRRQDDRRALRALFVGSSTLAVVLGTLFTALLWAEIEAESYTRVLAALLVLDALFVALQPILARARRSATMHRLRVAVASGETVDVNVEAPDLATAAALAIRRIERRGAAVLRVEVAGGVDQLDPVRERTAGRSADVLRTTDLGSAPATIHPDSAPGEGDVERR